MANVERMFQVIVLGGMALVAVPIPTLVAGCGGSIAKPDSAQPDAGHDTGSFPQEGPPSFDSGAFPQETATQIDSGTFPQEGLVVPVDSGFPQEGVDASGFDSGFPQEGPAMIDSGTMDGSFPQETAVPFDSGQDTNDDAKG